MGRCYPIALYESGIKEQRKVPALDVHPHGIKYLC
jgi:hypothetical protein